MKNFKTKLLSFLLIISCIASLCSCSLLEKVTNDTATGSVTNPNVEVHIIDVGQADSILIESDNSYMIIDGGNTGDADTIINYLNNEGVKKLEYVIGTHPHEDHIGALDKVIDSFDVGKVILPDVQTTSKTFKELLTSISDKGLKITKPKTGTSYDIGKVSFTILGPNADYGTNYNDWSVAIKLVDGDISYMLSGDAETDAENDILKTGIDLSCDVLKCGHHGSDTATTDAFLKAVNPKYALISCGEGNKYGHPHQSTLDKLDNAGISYFRTDLVGTIIAASDGKKVEITTEKGGSASSSSSNTNAETSATQSSSTDNSSSTDKTTYILNTSSKTFHLPDCSVVSKMSDKNSEEYTGTKQELLDLGYTACQKCNP